MRELKTFLFFVLACAITAYANDDLDIARQALRDGLWSVARSHAEKVPGDEARLIVLESYANENRWEDVKRELLNVAHPEENPAFGYYQAITTGKIEQAIDFLRQSGSVAGVAEAKMLEADLQLLRANTNEARRLWTDVLSVTNASERAFAFASINLGNIESLRTAYQRTSSVHLKRIIGLRLGRLLVSDSSTKEEGARLIRAIVSDNPDVEGACDAFVAIAIAELSSKNGNEALKTISDAMEIWPAAAKRYDVQECRGEALRKLGRYEEALQAYIRAEEVASTDAARARAILRQGDVLSALGRGNESIARYHVILENHPLTDAAVELKKMIKVREREAQGREDYRNYHFEDAMEAFSDVADADVGRVARMEYFKLLCLYGLGRDEEALTQAKKLSSACDDLTVRADATLWLAKFTYNRGEWREAFARFMAYVEIFPEGSFAPDALLWAARAAFAANDFALTITTVSQLVARYPRSSAATSALLIQAEALIELARFDEAILVLDRAATVENLSSADRLKVRLLKADALFAMGADNSARYQVALDVYRNIADDPMIAPSLRLVVAFKIGRTLEKLKRMDEATDLYYSQVVLAYRDGRLRGQDYDAEGQATFTRAAFRLADDFEARGRDYQAIGVLKLVVDSDVPAATEAESRIQRITKKGRFL